MPFKFNTQTVLKKMVFNFDSNFDLPNSLRTSKEKQPTHYEKTSTLYQSIY